MMAATASWHSKKPHKLPNAVGVCRLSEHSPVWEWESNFVTFLCACTWLKQALWLMDPSSKQSTEASGVPQLLDTTPYSTPIFSALSSHCLFPHGQRDYPGCLWVAALGGVWLLVLSSTSQCPSLRAQQQQQQRTLSNRPPPHLADPTKHRVGQPELRCSNN